MALESFAIVSYVPQAQLQVQGRDFMLEFLQVCFSPRYLRAWLLFRSPIVESALLQNLHECFEEAGMKCSMPQPPYQQPPVLFKQRNQENIDVLKEAMEEAKKAFRCPAQILFVLMERGMCRLWDYMFPLLIPPSLTENQVYNDVKLICDHFIGVQSQCLVAPNMGMTPHAKAGAMVRAILFNYFVPIGRYSTCL